jgi:hypothetical protein
MSPEQCRGGELTWRTDQYALGVIAYELLAGAPPFDGSAYEVMHGHTEGRVPDLTAVRPDCPPSVAAAVTRMLAKDPTDRFGSMAEALTALGATRASMSDSTEAAISRLAVPLPHEEGVVLVETPASPAPLPPPPVAAAVVRESRAVRVAKVNASLRRVFKSASLRVADAGLAGWRRVAALAVHLASRTGPLPRHVMRAGRAAADRGASLFTSGVRRVGTLPPRAWRALSLGLVVLAAVAIAVASGGPPTQVKLPTVAVSTGTIADSSERAPQDTAATNPADSVGTGPAAPLDPSAVVTDSNAPFAIAIRIADQKARYVTGDSLKLIAEVKDFRGTMIRDPNVRWKVSNRAIASVDPSTGWMHTRGSGVFEAIAEVDGLDGRLSLSIYPGAQPTAPRPPTSSRPATVATTRLAEGAVRDEIDREVSRFISGVIDRGDTAQMRVVDRSSAAEESAALQSLIEAVLSAKNRLRVRPEPDAPAARLDGDNARTDLRIGLLRGNTTVRSLRLFLDLTRVGSSWRVAGFRLREIE